MKKVIPFALATLLLTNGTALAHGTYGTTDSQATTNSQEVSAESHAKAKTLTVLVNGVKVASPANHIAADKKVYASVPAFADLFKKPYTVSKDKQSVSFNGKKIADVKLVNGEPTAWIEDLASAVGAQKVSWDGKKKELYVLALPEGTIQLDPTPVPKMGEHWANAQAGELPTGPIYGVYNGKLVFLEYMIAQEDFANGVNHVNLNGMKGVPMPAVVQVDVEYQSHGHPGFEVPHFDIHNYFITDEEQQAIE
ncbi:MAG: hypothetical protein ACM32O_02100 [Clostridia bacterium]